MLTFTTTEKPSFLQKTCHPFLNLKICQNICNSFQNKDLPSSHQPEGFKITSTKYKFKYKQNPMKNTNTNTVKIHPSKTKMSSALVSRSAWGHEATSEGSQPCIHSTQRARLGCFDHPHLLHTKHSKSKTYLGSFNHHLWNKKSKSSLALQKKKAVYAKLLNILPFWGAFLKTEQYWLNRTRYLSLFSLCLAGIHE